MTVASNVGGDSPPAFFSMMESLLNLCVNIHNNLMIAFDASQPVDNEYQENYKEIFQVQFGIGKAVIKEWLWPIAPLYHAENDD